MTQPRPKLDAKACRKQDSRASGGGELLGSRGALSKCGSKAEAHIP